MTRRFKQGKFSPQNPQKIIGDPTDIVYRSSWEKKVMVKFDISPTIIKWGSECFHIPYRCKTDNKIHRYFPDFIIITENAEKKRVVTVIEVKPEAQTKVPRRGRGAKSDQAYLNAVLTHVKNQSKWEAAEAYCKARGWNFVVMTEREIFNK